MLTRITHDYSALESHLLYSDPDVIGCTDPECRPRVKVKLPPQPHRHMVHFMGAPGWPEAQLVAWVDAILPAVQADIGSLRCRRVFVAHATPAAYNMDFHRAIESERR